MIISASRRTDIPAFYSEWFMNCIRDGFVCVKNPFNTHAISKVPLTPDLVDLIVFWTKDPYKFVRNLDELDERGYKYYFLFTLTPYGKDVECGLRDKNDIIKTFQELSRRIGKEKVVWRYDPIVLGGEMTVEWHLKKFKEYVELLAEFTESVVFSFLLEYKKIGKQEFRRPNLSEMKVISQEFAKIAKENGLKIKSCAEEVIHANGIEKSTCIDKELIERILGQCVNAARDKCQRKDCQCIESIDIGEYNSCLHLCKYCYANTATEQIKTNCKKHDPKSPLLIGQISEKDKVTDRKIKSFKSNQISMF